METLARITEEACQEAYARVDRALNEHNLAFSRKGHKYDIPNFPFLYARAVSIASDALKGTQFHATEIPYREERDRKPEFMAVLHLDDERYTY